MNSQKFYKKIIYLFLFLAIASWRFHKNRYFKEQIRWSLLTLLFLNRRGNDNSRICQQCLLHSSVLSLYIVEVDIYFPLGTHTFI